MRTLGKDFWQTRATVAVVVSWQKGGKGRQILAKDGIVSGWGAGLSITRRMRPAGCTMAVRAGLLSLRWAGGLHAEKTFKRALRQRVAALQIYFAVQRWCSYFPNMLALSADGPRCVSKRVDAFVVAYQIELAESLWGVLSGFRDKAERERCPVECDLAALVGAGKSLKLAVMPVGGEGKIVLRNGDLSVSLSRECSHGWTVEVRLFAAFLAQVSPGAALGTCRWVAGFFGAWDASRGERCRRFDLATDWVNWSLDESDDARFVTRPRARRCRFRPTREEASELPASRAYHVARVVTGLAVAYGAPCMGRIYDKSAELEHAGRDGKREFEHLAWKSGGWDGTQTVVRVEFQLRGDVLEEMGYRDDVERLLAEVDGVWKYLTEKWLTMREPDSASRLCRAALDARWEAVQRVDWGTVNAPVERVRRRGGASMKQALGCILSHLGATGALEASVDGLSAPSSVEASQLEPGVAASMLRAYIQRICIAFALAVETGLLVEKKLAQDAFASFLDVVRGTVARFSVIAGEIFGTVGGPEVLSVNGKRRTTRAGPGRFSGPYCAA